MLLFASFLFTCLHIVIGFIELVSEEGAQDHEFRLTCRRFSDHIAILEAQFTSIPNSTTVANTNLRTAMNQRCSGRNHCSFILHADCPGSKLWGPGSVFFKYACIPEDQVTRFCNLELIIPDGGGLAAQGFIMSPGYPKFYVGQSSCHWRIRAPINQRVEITLLDVSLSGSHKSVSEQCEDLLSVQDNAILFTTCHEHETAPTFVSKSNILDVFVLGRTGSLVPKRGVLIYYKAVECPTPTAPVDGYLVHRNISTAEFMCCVGFVFPDTLARYKVLNCLHNRWDQKLPTECVNFQNLTKAEEITDKHFNMTENSDFVDIVIPSLLIAGLLIGNAIIVFIIYRYRQRKHKDIQEEELNTMVTNNAASP